MVIQALIGPATKLLGKFIEDKDTKNKLAHDIATMAEKHAQELAKSQIEVNKMEAQSGHWFVASWRPSLVGCGIALAWHFVIAPSLLYFLLLCLVSLCHHCLSLIWVHYDCANGYAWSWWTSYF